jgi:hypothetical protein
MGNNRRNKEFPLQAVRTWDDGMFYRQFRLCRQEFNATLIAIAPALEKNTTKANNSSGSTINPELCAF